MHQPQLVLVVDDEAYFREIFSGKLKMLNYQVEVAEDGVQAVKKAKALQPDLILMDVKMPNMDGIEAVAKLKEDPATKDLRVVFLTNLGEDKAEMQEIDKRFSKDMGATGYIKKSDDLESVAKQIESFLQ